MTGLFLVSYLVAPVVMLGACLGAGLLVRRLAGGTLPALYVLPLGLAALVVVGVFLTTWDATAELTGPAFVVLALVSLVLERRRLRVALQPAGRWAWAAGAAAAGYAVMIAPALLSGRTTFTGYARIVDIAHQFDFARYLVSEGRVRPPARDTSYLEVVTKTLDIGYPGGAQSVFGGFAGVLGTDLTWIYQSFLAVTAAMTALAVFGLLRGMVTSRPLRAVAGAVAAQANVLVGYGLAGGFKELVSASLLLLTAALVRETAPHRAHPREMLPLAVTGAGALGAFNLTIVPWLGLLLAGAFVVSLVRGHLVRPQRRMRTLVAWAAMAVMTLVLAAPTVQQAVKLVPVAAQAEGADGADRTAIADLGNLTSPMPVKAVAGVWISGDIRRPELGDKASTTAMIAVVLALAAVGVGAAIRRREWALPLVGGASAAALAYFVLRTGPWIQLKAIAMTGPVVLALAFAGASALTRMLRRPLGAAAGWGLAGLVALGVLAGNANAYHDVTLAPSERLRDLERLGERFAGQGPALYPAFEEYAEYFLRRSDTIGLVNGAGEGIGFPQYRPAAVEAAAAAGEVEASGVRYVWDADDLEPEYLQRFELLVVRRGPRWSRPPSNYALAARTGFHDVWRQVRPPATVRMHVPLPAFTVESGARMCRMLTRWARRAGPQARLAYVRAPATFSADLTAGSRTPAWPVAGAGALRPYGPGFAQTTVDLPVNGTYRLWLRGPIQRELRILVDGKQVAAPEGEWSYPGQWSRLVQLRLPPGEHTVRVERNAGNLSPGDGAGGDPVGPIVFEQVSARLGQVEAAPLAAAARLCAEPEGLDWVELIEPDRAAVEAGRSHVPGE